MGSEWELILDGGDEQPMYDTAIEVWELVDRLDAQLSHFKDKSEISLINARAAHEPVLVEPELFQLLLFARDMWLLTEKSLDVAVNPAGEVAGFGHVTLDPERRLIAFDQPGVAIELGALGKGYAVDKGIELVAARGIPAASLSAGGSSGSVHGMPVTLRFGRETASVDDNAYSVSGTLEQPLHLIDPTTGAPVQRPISVLVVCPTALESEALSTAIAVRCSTEHQPDWLLAYMARCPGIEVRIAEGATATRLVSWQGRMGRETYTITE